MTSRDNEGWDNGGGDRGGHRFDGLSGSQSLGVDFSFAPITKPRGARMLKGMLVVLMVTMVSWCRERASKGERCRCNEARVTPISTNAIYRREGQPRVAANDQRWWGQQLEEWYAEQDADDLRGTCRPCPLWAASCQTASPASSPCLASPAYTAETLNSRRQSGKLLKLAGHQIMRQWYL